MIISQILAMSQNRTIGKENTLPWHIPEDFKYFKNKTIEHVLIMGRKTFESLGKPLKQRISIVISRSFEFDHDDVYIVNSLESAIAKARELNDKEEIFIIGGGEIYKASLPLTQRVYLTQIHQEFAGDVYYPELPSDFKEVSRIKKTTPIAYDWIVYERNLGS